MQKSPTQASVYKHAERLSQSNFLPDERIEHGTESPLLILATNIRRNIGE